MLSQIDKTRKRTMQLRSVQQTSWITSP
jgi:hypothetical protein